jgi:hypothetical protein
VLPGENPSGAIIGVLTIGAVLALESGSHETYTDTVLSALIAACMYWIVHAYATLLGDWMHEPQPMRMRALLAALRHERVILAGAVVPLGAVVLAWLLGAPLSVGVVAGVWTSVGVLLALELLAGIRVNANAGELAINIIVGVLLGLLVLSLRVLLRH